MVPPPAPVPAPAPATDNKIGKFCLSYCCCFTLTMITAQVLAGSMVFSLRAHHAVPAICQDGRLANAAADANASVAIDVPLGSVVELGCMVPVAVYDTRQLHEPRDNLRQVGLRGPTQIPFERANSGVTCIHHNASILDHVNNILGLAFYKNCETDKWDCNHGECGPYEKALRTCLSNLAPEEYECSYVPGKPMWGVTSTANQLTQGSLIFLGVAFMMFLSVIFVALDKDAFDEGQDREIRFKVDLCNAFLALVMLTFGAFFTYIGYQAMTSQRPFWNQVADLEKCTTGDLHMCGPVLLEEAPWNRTIGPMAYYLLHFLPLILCVSWVCCMTGCTVISVFFRPPSEFPGGLADPPPGERTPLV